MKNVNQWIPRIIVNCKTYLEALGDRALDLAQKAEEIGQVTQVPIGIAPQYTDLSKIAGSVGIPVFAQHIDPVSPGKYTGHILPDAIAATGAIGTLINHSERQLTLSKITQAIKSAKEKKLLSVVCTKDAKMSATVATLNPNILAIEPPELIGTGISVSKAKPELITDTIQAVRKSNLTVRIFCGAGVSTKDDVLAAIKLGAQGILVSSSIVKAKNQYALLHDFALAFKKGD
jgi:triosephosphate isomerase